MVFTKVTTAIVAIALLSIDSASAADGFAKIATDFGESKPTGVVLPSICIGTYTVPKPMYTFEPAGVNETVSIETKPADLVEAGYEDETGLIFFKFNQTVADTATDAGVIIKFPPAELESINICCTQSAQIKPGFTNFKSLVATTTSNVDAAFATQNGDLAVVVQSKAVVNVKVDATEDSKVGILAETEASVNVDGDITIISCLDESTCKVKGAIALPDQSRADGASTIKTTSCEGVEVKKESTCESKDPKVIVATDGPLVFSDVKEQCFGGDDLYGANGPAPTDVPTVSPAPTTSPMPSVSPSKGPTNLPTIAPTAPPSGAMAQGVFISAVLGGAALLLLLCQ